MEQRRSQSGAIWPIMYIPPARCSSTGTSTNPPLAPFDVAARGFRDTTRIAAADPEVWEAIFLANREAMAASTREFLRALAELGRLLDTGDGPGLRAALARIKARREALS